MRAILTKVTDEMYDEIRKRMEQYGFTSVYEFVHGIVGMALKQMDKMEYKRQHPGVPTVDDDIDEMFEPLNNWETPRYGERTKRGHKAWDYFCEQDTGCLPFAEEEDDEQG